MNLHIISLVILLLFFISSCDDSNKSEEGNENSPTETSSESITINGNITDASEGKMYLYSYEDGTNFTILDSAAISAEGTFSINKAQNGYEFLGLGPTPARAMPLLVKSGEEISVSGPLDNWQIYAEVEGSENSELIKEYYSKKMETSQKLQGLQTNLQMLNQNDFDAMDSINKIGLSIQGDFEEYKYSFLDKNIDKPAVYVVMNDLNDIENDFEHLEKIKATINKFLPNSIFSTMINNKISNAEQMKQQKEAQLKQQEAMKSKMAQAGIAIGLDAPELNYPNPQGKKIALSSLEGKVVLLDFWASWCKPCRMENPNVVKLYDQYKDKGFTVYSYSLDKEVNAWMNAIAQDGLIWPNHVSDLKFWNAEGAKKYQVNSIPQTFLIGEDGKIIAIGLRGKDLENKLKEILG